MFGFEGKRANVAHKRAQLLVHPLKVAPQNTLVAKSFVTVGALELQVRWSGMRALYVNSP